MAELENRKQETLCQEYLIDLNQTQAAIRAGYNPNTARTTSSELFAKPDIRARVDELMAERSKRTGVNQERIIRELARIAFVKAPNLIDNFGNLKDDASDDDTAAISAIRTKVTSGKDGESSIEREVRLSEKSKALELLGKHLGMYTDKIDLNIAPVSVTVKSDWGE